MSTKRIDADKAAEFLRNNDDFLILTHASPDGDTLGSAFALCNGLSQLGKHCMVVCPDEIPQKYNYLLADYPTFTPKTLVAVDVADQKLLGALCEQYAGKINLTIDHHKSNVGYSDLLYLDDTAAAACECIYNVLLALGCEITPYIANCLYTGLATDTGCFKFSNTTPTTHRIAATLMEKGADYSEINRIMFETKSRERVALERLVLENIEFAFDGQLAFFTVTEDMIKSTGCDQSDLDGVTAMSRQIEGVKIGVTIKEKTKGLFKVSVRTFEPFDASLICAKFGGGGHNRAAGCEFNCSVPQIKEQLIDEIAKLLN